ncbi:MAG: hypothetical protein LBK62_12380 [Treponema sp.]|jgi:hypothetical protein|nr:hypothetical protein [Treponema sp.]
MATNRNFQDEEAGGETKKQYTYWVCPQCGKTADMRRHYCSCHADLSRSKGVAMSSKPPDVFPCNFETPRVTCDDCPEKCAWCPSFAALETNKYGFGGKDCRGRGTTTRCLCCQTQIKIGLEINAEIDINAFLYPKTGIGETDTGGETEEKKDRGKTMGQLAKVMRDYMERPVLARINHNRGQIG